MNFQNIEIFYQVGQKALTCYGIGDSHQLSLLHLSENITFLVSEKRTGDIYGVLRVSRPGYHTWEELGAEIRWLKQIELDTQVMIARPLDNARGQTVTTVVFEEWTYFCVISEYLSGEAPNPFDRERGLLWFEQAGEIASLLHRHTMSWTEGKHLCRPVWNYEALLGEQALFGDWRICQELGREGYGLLERSCSIIKKRLQMYGAETTRFGLIHSDLRAANLLVDGEQMKVLDFDDSGYGWHLHDLAASISFLEDSNQAEDWITAWIRGYERSILLDKRDYEEIDTFIMSRRIQLLAWITSHDDSDPVKLCYEGFAEGTLKMAEQYLSRKG